MNVATLLLRCAIVVGLCLLLPAAASAASSNSVHYHRCMADAVINPQAALADAEGWARAGGGVPAEHCAASALFNLKRYADAGKRLDRAAGSPAKLDVEFRVALFNQAGNAWLVAGDGARAVQSFSGALALSANDADLYADLARAQAMRRNWHEVVLDLNAALQLSPRRADFLVLRASAKRALKRYEEAKLDIDAALKLTPGDGSALVERGLLRRQLGDLGGARRDFQAALKAGPTAIAAEAKENLEEISP